MDNGLAALKAAGLFDKPAPVNTESNRPESNAPALLLENCQKQSNSLDRGAYLRE
jgi:hypothetical protein